MQKIILFTVLLLVTLITKLTAQELNSEKSALEWSFKQTEEGSYEMGSDKNPEFSNQNVFTIKSVKNKIKGFGNILKTITSDLYLDKTVKMTVYVKSTNVKSWAGLWMRVDYYNAKVLAFDNMQNRAIKGTTDWEKYEVVLFVPKEATSISYGVLLDGTGQIWFKDVTVVAVDDNIAETGSIKGREMKPILFETRAKAIANQIKKITDEEKRVLKTEIDSLDNEVGKGSISKEKAENLKFEKAKQHAGIIDAKVAIEEGKLNQLVQDKVDGKIEDEKANARSVTSIVIGSSNDSIGTNNTEINVTSMKIYQGQNDKENRHYKRTTTQLVLATGFNNLATNKSFANSDFRYLGSHFYEWGLTANTRIFKNDNLLHAKYGFSVMYNNLRPTDNRQFVATGNQTNLELDPVHQDDSRFKNVYLVVPVHLEFDFSGSKTKGDKTFFKTHDSFRLGLGGYFGTNLKSKQYLNYDNDDVKSETVTKADFNTSNFIYGLSTYIGYKSTSLYLKYDLNPLFKNNIVKQNNVSLGIRFDFN